jgi:hypothetical protein
MKKTLVFFLLLLITLNAAAIDFKLYSRRVTTADSLRLQVERDDIIVFVGQIVQDLREMATQKEQLLKFIPFDKHYEMI